MSKFHIIFGIACWNIIKLFKTDLRNIAVQIEVDLCFSFDF